MEFTDVSSVNSSFTPISNATKKISLTTIKFLAPEKFRHFSSVENLILYNNSFQFPFQPSPSKELKKYAPFAYKYPDKFSIINDSQFETYASSLKTMNGISIIFLARRMKHFYHFMEHLLPAFASVQELYSNNNYGVKYALFPNLDIIQCHGKYGLHKKLLRLLWPNIQIMCGQDIEDISSSPVLLQHNIITMSDIIQGIVPCEENPACIWLKSEAPYFNVIKKHSFELAKQVMKHLPLKIWNMPHFKEIPKATKYRMCFLSYGSLNRGWRMKPLVREMFFKLRAQHSYFGNIELFDFQVLQMEKYQFDEQIAVISTCNLVIGLPGNGLTHILWIAIQSKYSDVKLVVELLPGINVDVIDFLMQAEFAHAYHMQWDINGKKLISGSLDFGNFKHCPVEFYRNRGEVQNAVVQHWSNDEIIHMFDALKTVFQYISNDRSHYGMDLSELRNAMNDSKCIDM